MTRHTTQTRCAGCGLIPLRCLCNRLPRVQLPWRLLVLQHGKEMHKPTNTARLLARTIENCSIVPFATRERPWNASLLGPPSERYVVLFPAKEAQVLDRARLQSFAEQPTCLILLDGTWRQARRMVRRAAGVATLPRVTLPAGGPSRWRIRVAPRADQLCTFETIVRLAALLPESMAAGELERAFQLVLAAQGPHHVDGE